MIDPKAAIVLSAAHGMDQVAYADAVSGFESAGFSVVVEQRDLEFFASLQYLAPAALMVYVLKPYADKFLGKLAEDNYESCKAGLKTLWANFAAKDRKRRSIVISTKGKVTDETLSTDISFLARTADEQAFRLLFPRDISEEQFQKAIRGVTTPNVKNRTLRTSGHSFETARGCRGLGATLRAVLRPPTSTREHGCGKVSPMTLSLQYVLATQNAGL